MVEAIYKSAFQLCTELGRIRLPNSLKHIAPWAFTNCKSIVEVTIPESVTIPDLVTEIGNNAFTGCSSLESAIIIPASTTTIGDKAFNGCAVMANITIDERLTAIGDNVFQGCKAIQEFTIPNNVTTMGKSVFRDCEKLARVNIGTGLTAIADSTFYGCSALTSISIPENITKIGDNTFKGCTGITDLYICDRNTELALGADKKLSPFSDCPLKLVYIGGNIKYPGQSAFYANITLEKVIISDNRTEIVDAEFCDCTALKYITIGDGLTRIGKAAFSGCNSLEYFRTGTGLNVIDTDAFSFCTSLNEMVVNAATPPTCAYLALDGIKKQSCKLFIPHGSIDLYKAAAQWKEFYFISDYDGVTDISIDAETRYDVYNMQGAKVGSELLRSQLDDLLPGGVYILVSPDTTRKVKL